MSVYLHVLGCRLNRAEAEAWDGIPLVAAPAAASLCVLHGCAVTARSERTARQHIHRWLRLGVPRIAVTGCLARHWQATGGAPAGVELVLQGWPSLPPAADPALPAPPRRTRRTLKLQDGCSHRCAYCIIPSLRPGEWHAEPAAALAQVRAWVEAGAKEIVLTGLHLASYRHGDTDLVAFLQQALALPGAFRLRLSSLEPHTVTDALLDLIAAQQPRLCPHLHLPLQSGSDDVLRRMRRPYGRADLDRLLTRLRARLPLAALTADCITGFPGETEDDFAATEHVARAYQLARVHAFPFSPRPGTPAASFPGRVPERVAQERVTRLAATVAATARTYRELLIGTRQTVLTERAGRGYTETYQAVRLPASVPANQFVDVVVTGATDDGVSVSTAASAR